jgi:hypothetical protein
MAFVLEIVKYRNHRAAAQNRDRETRIQQNADAMFANRQG